MRSFKKKNVPRLIMQWSVLGFLILLAIRGYFQKEYLPDFEAYCPFGGIQALSSYLLNNSLACSMTTAQISMAIMLMIGILLFSKLFCAYICPLGTISEWLGQLGDKYKIRLKISGLADKILRSLKYFLLFITFYYTLQSNELFCKKFDPYYAVASGFSMDVVLVYAALSLLLLVVGSLVIRLFWCKYLCPLGAVSNIIRFTWLFLSVVVGYYLVLKAGLQLSYTWPLAIVCLGGYILELKGTPKSLFPVAKITRNENSCTSCGLCSLKCPQVIEVARMQVVTDADCNLCGDCLSVCPERETLQINKRNNLKWLPAVMVAILLIIGILLGSVWELPTISQRWGSPDQLEKAAVLTQSGLKSIKCFGSSSAFAAKMQTVKGVLGVETYVSTHKVRIFYDPALQHEQQLQAEMFSPRKTILRTPASALTEVRKVSLLLDNFFDPLDFDNLALLLNDQTDVLALESEFSCPVTVRIYFPGNNTLSESRIKEILETRQYLVRSGMNEQKLNLEFRVAGDISIQTIPVREYLISLFEPTYRSFNWKPAYSKTKLDSVMLPVSHSQYQADALPYLISHISNDSGVIGFRAAIDSAGQIHFNIVFVDSLTNSNNIMKAIKSDTLTVNYEGGEIGKIASKFHF